MREVVQERGDFAVIQVDAEVLVDLRAVDLALPFHRPDARSRNSEVVGIGKLARLFAKEKEDIAANYALVRQSAGEHFVEKDLTYRTFAD